MHRYRIPNRNSNSQYDPIVDRGSMQPSRARGSRSRAGVRCDRDADRVGVFCDRIVPSGPSDPSGFHGFPRLPIETIDRPTRRSDPDRGARRPRVGSGSRVGSRQVESRRPHRATVTCVRVRCACTILSTRPPPPILFGTRAICTIQQSVAVPRRS